MSFELDLLNTYKKHFKSVFEEFKLEQNSSSSDGMGAVMYFSNKELKILLVNDRGIIDLEIAGATSEDYQDAELLINLLKLDVIAEKSLSKNERKRILTTRHGLLEQSQLLVESYQDLVKRFSSRNIKATYALIDKLGNERSEHMFGRL